MRKVFKTYHRYNVKIPKIIIYILLILLGFIFSLKILFKSNSINNNLLMIGSNNIINNTSIFDLLNINTSTPDNILSLMLNNATKEDMIPVIKEDISKPIVYIYNTHQTEEYEPGLLKNYNITPTVYMAANILKKKLELLNIDSIVEDENISIILKEHNWKYKDSYYASRLWLENIRKKYPSIIYFIDLHRDSVTKTVEINDKPYAKLMFVIGMNHENHTQNEKLVLKLNDYLKENYVGLMRDILYAKKNKFNQDFDPNTILVEVGGPGSTIIEVQNSIEALANALAYVIEDNYGRNTN